MPFLNPLHTTARKYEYFCETIRKFWASQVAQLVQNLPAMQETAWNRGDLGLIPGSGRSPGAGKGNLLQDVCLRNSMDRGAWQVPALGVTRVGLSSEHLHSSENFSNWWKKQSWTKRNHKYFSPPSRRNSQKILKRYLISYIIEEGDFS